MLCCAAWGAVHCTPCLGRARLQAERSAMAAAATAAAQAAEEQRATLVYQVEVAQAELRDVKRALQDASAALSERTRERDTQAAAAAAAGDKASSLPARVHAWLRWGLGNTVPISQVQLLSAELTTLRDRLEGQIIALTQRVSGGAGPAPEPSLADAVTATELAGARAAVAALEERVREYRWQLRCLCGGYRTLMLCARREIALAAEESAARTAKDAQAALERVVRAVSVCRCLAPA